MKWKQAGIRMIILTMMVLVCVPCPVKREIKLALNIPVSNQEPDSKVNKTVVCQSFAEKTIHSSINPVSKQLLKPVFHSFAKYFVSEQRSDVSSTLYPDYPIPGTKIPLHILNEQYLI
ncbi:hypothetical protein [Fluviicola sp.]|uniref:hypothetical protein n=1 Tax=Fluviicola sp. TaxID=1917219 RepID=UPI002605158F|nr:hypothetical protein [Fluviicola sp.]